MKAPFDILFLGSDGFSVNVLKTLHNVKSKAY